MTWAMIALSYAQKKGGIEKILSTSHRSAGQFCWVSWSCRGDSRFARSTPSGKKKREKVIAKMKVEIELQVNKKLKKKSTFVN